MKPILEFYRSVLEDLGCVVNDAGQVLYPAEEGKLVPLEITVRRNRKSTKMPLWLPMQELLDNDDGKKVYFHPACESVFRGQSEVLNAVLQLANVRLYKTSVQVIESLLTLAADSKKANDASQALLEYALMQLPEVSSTTLDRWRKMIVGDATTGASGKRPVCKLQLSRLDPKGKREVRGCNFSVPLVENDYYGYKLSKIANLAITKAMEITYGDVPVEVESRAAVAPYFTALMECFHRVMKHIMKLAKLLKPYMATPVEYDGSWAADLDELGDWYNNDLYVQLEGNIGQGGEEGPSGGSDTIRPPAVNAPPAATHAASAPAQTAPAPSPTPSKQEDDDNGYFKPPTYQTPQAPQHYNPYPPQAYSPPPPPAAPQPGGYPPNYGYPQQQQPAASGYWDPRTGEWRAGPVGAPPPQQPMPPQYAGYPNQGYPQQGYPQPPAQYGGYPQQPGQPRIIGTDPYGRPMYG